MVRGRMGATLKALLPEFDCMGAVAAAILCTVTPL